MPHRAANARIALGMKGISLALSLAAAPAFRAPAAVPNLPAPLLPLAATISPQALGLPPLSYAHRPGERVPVYYRAFFARALAENAAELAAVIPAPGGLRDGEEIRLRGFLDAEYAWGVEAVVRRSGAEIARLRVFVGKEDGRVAIVPSAPRPGAGVP